jgi:hypothetical protein
VLAVVAAAVEDCRRLEEGEVVLHPLEEGEEGDMAAWDCCQARSTLQARYAV